MNAPLRRGACPALSDPMATGDGLIARLNPAGGISPDVLAGLADAALAFGNGLMEVTQRGNLQFRGLTPDSAPLLADAVNRLGVTAMTGLTVDVGALSGLDPAEIADPRPLADSIRKGAAAFAGRLGPKVSVIVDGGNSGMDAMQADLRLTAVRKGAATAWRLALAGDATSAKPVGDLDEAGAAKAAISLLCEIAAEGKAARARDLPPAVVQKAIGEEALPQPISPRVGEMAGRPEGDAKDRTVNRIASLEDGRFALWIALPFGSMDAADLRKFVNAAKDLGAIEVRFAPRRSLILICPTEGSALGVRQAASDFGLVTTADDPRHFVVACAGAPACASGHIPARLIANDVAAGAVDLLDGSLTVHVSGCAKGCAHPGPAALTFVGGAEGVALVAGGTASGRPARHVAESEIVAEAERLSNLVRNGRRQGENAARCLARLGDLRHPEAAE